MLSNMNRSVMKKISAVNAIKAIIIIPRRMPLTSAPVVNKVMPHTMSDSTFNELFGIPLCMR